jgi:hypothetical protein
VTIICLGLSLSAYQKLQAISSDVYDITDNWKTEPVIGVFVPASHDADCPDGFAAISIEKSDFTGITKGPCGCVPNVNGYISSAANCSVAEEATAYCMSAPARDAVKSKSWRDSKICFKRGGKPATSWTEGYYRRPYPDADGACPTDYKRCGTGLTYEQGAVCFPADSPCPITGMLVAPADDPLPAEGGWQSAGTFPGDEYLLLTRREHEGELPVVDLEMHLTLDNSQEYTDGDSYNPDDNRRGPCYLGTKQKFSNKPLTISDDFLWLFSVSYPTMCKREDKRFELFDQRDLQRHFLENLANGHSSCSGHELLPINDPDYTTAADPDYQNSHVPCDDSSAGYVCSRPSDQFTNCAAGDNICNVVINQNVCGQYAQAVRTLADSENTFGMYRRGEIVWHEDCAVTQDQIYTNIDPLTAALSSQMAGVVVSFVFGILFGLAYPAYGLWAGNVPNKWRINTAVEKRLLYIDPFLHLFKLGPLIAAIFYIGQVRYLLRMLGFVQCGTLTSVR